MRAVVLAVACSVASAFVAAPMPTLQTPKTVVKAFESEVGVQAPLGMFDPLGLLEDGALLWCCLSVCLSVERDDDNDDDDTWCCLVRKHTKAARVFESRRRCRPPSPS